jgi:hypothetical protein
MEKLLNLGLEWEIHRMSPKHLYCSQSVTKRSRKSHNNRDKFKRRNDPNKRGKPKLEV